MRSPIEIDVPMVGLLQPSTRLILLNLTITLMRQAWYVPWTWTLISTQINQPYTILRISYEYWPELIKELVTSSSTAKLQVGERTINGDCTED